MHTIRLKLPKKIRKLKFEILLQLTQYIVIPEPPQSVCVCVSVLVWFVWIAEQTLRMWKYWQLLYDVRSEHNIDIIFRMLSFPIDKKLYSLQCSPFKKPRPISQPTDGMESYKLLFSEHSFFSPFRIAFASIFIFFNRLRRKKKTSFLSVIQCQSWIMIRYILIFIVSIDRIKIEILKKKI